MEIKFHSKKTAAVVLISLVLLVCTSAAGSISSVNFVFSGSSSGWVTVKASLKNSSVPDSKFMLHPPADTKNFVFNRQKGVWRGYTVTVSENSSERCCP